MDLGLPAEESASYRISPRKSCVACIGRGMANWEEAQPAIENVVARFAG